MFLFAHVVPARDPPTTAGGIMFSRSARLLEALTCRAPAEFGLRPRAPQPPSSAASSGDSLPQRRGVRLLAGRWPGLRRPREQAPGRVGAATLRRPHGLRALTKAAGAVRSRHAADLNYVALMRCRRGHRRRSASARLYEIRTLWGNAADRVDKEFYEVRA
jgi:hypothetical protein